MSPSVCKSSFTAVTYWLGFLRYRRRVGAFIRWLARAGGRATHYTDAWACCTSDVPVKRFTQKSSIASPFISLEPISKSRGGAHRLAPQVLFRKRREYVRVGSHKKLASRLLLHH